MRRRLFSVASALLLLLCVMTVVLWVRSYSHYDRAYCGWPTVFSDKVSSTTLSVTSFKSAFRIQWTTTFDDNPLSQVIGGSETHAIVPNYPIYHPDPKLLGFGVFVYSWAIGPFGSGFYAHIVEVAIPHWAVLVVSLAVGIVLARKAKHLARRGGACVKCGYDLTGNTSGTCPECGTAVERMAGA